MKAKVQSIGNNTLAIPIETCTCDVSPKGLLLQPNRRLPEGTPLQLTLHLPAKVTGKPVLVWCVSRVVRVADGGVGVVIESYQYVRAFEEK